jgi:ribosomal protein S18 acetylase RimI-like enzyme
MNMNIEIRPFDKDDIQCVAEILLHSFKDKFHLLKRLPENKQIQFLIDSGFVDGSPFDGYIVAEKNGKIVGVMLLKWKGQKRIKSAYKVPFSRLVQNYGFVNTIRILIGFSILEESTTKEECYIEHIAVAPEARGLGIGTKLLDHALRYTGKTPGLSTTSLYVAASNVSAQRLYERMGFIVRRNRKSWLTKVVFHEYSWLYMIKNQGAESPKNRFVMKSGWWLGFLGLLGLPYIKTIIYVFKGDVSPIALLGLLWFLWFGLFIPEEKG